VGLCSDFVQHPKVGISILLFRPTRISTGFIPSKLSKRNPQMGFLPRTRILSQFRRQKHSRVLDFRLPLFISRFSVPLRHDVQHTELADGLHGILQLANYVCFSSLSPLKMTSNDVPMSANTAIHSVAIPPNASKVKIALTPSATAILV
jgi:hypothetical protein